MVACAVLSCKRRSDSSNSQQDHVSYHKFPKDVIIKEKWKKFCNENESWKPTRTSVICSEHFTPESYKNANNRKILVEGAIPSLRLCPCSWEPQVKIRIIEPTTCSDAVIRSSQCLIDKPTENKYMPTPTIPITASTSVAPPHRTIPSTQGAFSESPRIRKLRAQLQSKNKKIRQLRDKNRYLKGKVETLKELLTNLEKKYVMNKEEKNILNTIGVTEKE